MKHLPIILISILTLSCSRTTYTDDNTGLTGIWIQTESLIDPGNGSGSWMPVQSNPGYIQFKADSTLSSSTNLFDSYTRYEIKSDSTMQLTAPPSSNQRFVYYKISGNTLELSPTCIERCSFRFKRK